MSSRINIIDVEDEFGKDYAFPHKGRCAKMGKGFDYVIRRCVNDKRAQPIIAKGNRFDKVTAKW